MPSRLHKDYKPKKEPQQERDVPDYFKEPVFVAEMDKVLEFITERKRTIGECSRHFGNALKNPLLDLLDRLRSEGRVSFQETGSITWVSIGGVEILPPTVYDFRDVFTIGRTK
jgi:hypothetical protein